MDARELQKRIIEEPMPHISGIAVFVTWCVINGHADPRYADNASLNELWAKFSMEATDGVRAQVDVKQSRGYTAQDIDKLKYELDDMRRRMSTTPVMYGPKAASVRW